MFSRKCLVFIVMFTNCLKQILTISTGTSEIVPSLGKLEERNVVDFPTYNRKLKSQSYFHYPNKYRKYTQPNIYNPLGQNMYFHPANNQNFEESSNINLQEMILDILYSIARNDDLHCVPKLLCEITSGTVNGRQQNYGIPLSINAGSLLELISSMSGLERSPLFYFGKAAVLGYSSKGNSRSCSTAYPRCPSDSNKLIQYLNNHNGGFFRYFKGFSSENEASDYQHPYYQSQHFGKRDNQPTTATRRIQNKPGVFIDHNNLEGFIKFPDDHLKYTETPKNVEKHNIFSFGRPYKSLKFPSDYSEGYRTPKTISNFYSDQNILKFERPHYNKVPEIIFPDRTGTGELIIDSAEFDNTNIAYEDNDVRIKYSGYQK